jgi:uncharacterized membrane protein YccC
MSELLAVVNGLLLGAIAGQYQPASRRLYVLLACIMGGVLASMVGQLSNPEPSILAVDFVLVVVSASAGLFSARRFSVGRRG